MRYSRDEEKMDGQVISRFRKMILFAWFMLSLRKWQIVCTKKMLAHYNILILWNVKGECPVPLP